MELRIAEIRQETARIRSFFLDSRNSVQLPLTTPGAHIDVDLGTAGSRSYSIINPGNTASYHIAVQKEDNSTGGSKAMHEFCVGDSLTVSSPENDFELSKGNHPSILLAGGIGITPLLGMAASLSSQDQRFSFIYCARTRADMAFASDSMVLHVDDASGPPDLDALLAGLTPATHLYVCGPRPMIEAAKAVAQAKGLDAAHIHFEVFTSNVPNAGDQSFEVEIADTGEVFTIPPGQSIIEVLGAAGVSLIYDCQRGDCGICQTDVIKGIPDHRDVVLSKDEKASGKVMQICVSRAMTPRLVLDL